MLLKHASDFKLISLYREAKYMPAEMVQIPLKNASIFASYIPSSPTLTSLWVTLGWTPSPWSCARRGAGSASTYRGATLASFAVKYKSVVHPSLQTWQGKQEAHVRPLIPGYAANAGHTGSIPPPYTKLIPYNPSQNITLIL